MSSDSKFVRARAMIIQGANRRRTYQDTTTEGDDAEAFLCLFESVGVGNIRTLRGPTVEQAKKALEDFFMDDLAICTYILVYTGSRSSSGQGSWVLKPETQSNRLDWRYIQELWRDRLEASNEARLVLFMSEGNYWSRALATWPEGYNTMSIVLGSGLAKLFTNILI